MIYIIIKIISENIIKINNNITNFLLKKTLKKLMKNKKKIYNNNLY